MEVLLSVEVLASMEIYGSSTVGGSVSFHGFHQIQLPRIYSVEASVSLHIPLHTSIHFHEYHKPPAASRRQTLTLTM